MKCLKCGKEYDDSFEFCPFCAEKKPEEKKDVKCPTCGKTYDPSYAYCPYCAVEKPAEPELVEVKEEPARPSRPQYRTTGGWWEKVEASDWVALGSAVLLFIALCLPWVKGTGREFAETMTGETVYGQSTSHGFGPSFGWVSIISVLAILVIFLFIFVDIEIPIPRGYAYLGAGGLAVIMAVLVMATKPMSISAAERVSMAQQGIALSKSLGVGAYIGLIAAIGIVVAGILELKPDLYWNVIYSIVSKSEKQKRVKKASSGNLAVLCQNCGWRGFESETVGKAIEDEHGMSKLREEVCPKCGSENWDFV